MPPLPNVEYKRLDLRAEVLKFERGLISQTLAKVNGKITHAAKLLGVGYQTLAYILAYIIETKPPDSLKKRTPVRRRPRKQRRNKIPDVLNSNESNQL